MSVISDRHLFVPFVSGTSKPFDSQRLAKVGYKAKSGKASVCISIPELPESAVTAINAAFPVDLRKRAEDFQDALLRSLYESDKTEVSSGEIDQRAILAYLESENNAGRLSAEKVRDWFTGDFAETALPILAEKYSTEDETVLAQKMSVWCGAFVALTGNSAVDVNRLNQLSGMLDFVADDDIIGNRVKTKVAQLIADFQAQNAL